ncbi:MAG: hypothetical protein GQ574_00295 [Crocinitomix sp.]|nr:hypothetical protein [Crocinitomix sp.]
MEVDKKIEELGGLDFFTKSTKLSEDERLDFIELYDIAEHKEFIDFIDRYGGRSFNKAVCCCDVKEVPGFPSRKIPLSTLLGFVKGAFGIIEIDELIEDNIPTGFIAFAMGDPTGDYWCYHIKTKSIHFWQHDAPEDEDTFTVTNSIKDLILKCEVEEDDETEEGFGFIQGDFIDDYFDN